MMKNVFFIGLDEFNRTKLGSIRGAEDCRFHGLLEPEAFVDADAFPVQELLASAERELERFPGSVDAIIGYMDFPATIMTSILARKRGLRGASLESVLQCEHKYWSRVRQREVIGAHIPRFRVFDPYSDAALRSIDLHYPFWVKPVKSFGSHLGFRINNAEQLRRAAVIIRAGIGRLAEPFNYVLGLANLPEEIAHITGHHCIAEEIVSGRQCTLEGAVFDGKVRVHGVVDSIRDRNRSTFNRYQYPSQIPLRIQQRMHAIVERFLEHIAFDNSCFNAEYLWNPEEDRIWFMETNPRIAQHHSDLFEKVDGATNHQAALDVALNRTPRFPRREGTFGCAAVFFLREFADARVERVPTPEEVRRIEARFPGTLIQIKVRESMRLSELFEQDSYSYVCAMVYMGADNTKQLLANYKRCVSEMNFRFRREPDT